jgi:hypothetical protein
MEGRPGGFAGIPIADIVAGTVRRLAEDETEVEDDQVKGLLPWFVEA